ncbi:AbfB domain-containing protein [Streptomyces sp. GC420]|uniref:AbfB domain-containing protein n=1 Tax=Streptomyces sp. GC420 TaxID=2697568 RepID=UPI001414F579|nr:AbfB domain-containing protein [Streptomyces sp. GC420]NBM15649.1 alpha-L-arabinofuranosidase [Streptomyces sp. GC420]
MPEQKRGPAHAPLVRRPGSALVRTVAPTTAPDPEDLRLFADRPHPALEAGGGAGGTDRIPGTRRLWLAGALAAAVLVTSVTAIALLDRNAGHRPAQDRTTSAADGSPVPEALLPGTPGEAVATPEGKAGLTSPQADRTPASGSASPQDGRGADARASASAPSFSGTRTPGRTTSPSPGAGGGAPPASASKKSVQSVNYPDRHWLVHSSGVGLDPVGPGSSAGSRQAATFTVVPGLADPGCHSFSTGDGRYLRHRDFRLRADRDDGSTLFEQDATFCPRASSFPGATMLESYNYRGRFLRHFRFGLRLDPYQHSDIYRADAAFRLVKALAG